MAIRRRFNLRSRRPLRKLQRRFWRKRITARRNLNATKVYNIARTFRWGSFATNNTVATTGTIGFSLAALPDYGDFTNLFDQFRIMAVKVEIIPTFTGSDTNPATTTTILRHLYTAIDYDDTTSPADENEMLCKPSMKRTRGHLTHKRYFVPAISASVYKGVASTGYAIKKKQWLDCTDANIPHYGLKYFMEANNITGNNLVYNIYAKLYMQFRGVQ